uniref:Uncharacterized protein n=1 Tax=Babesia bovis TaxID=5865 RepID=A7AW61_BABBO|eukprot:XP_001608857.1 hypothetical protein [Babesia bovis T2Bo]
MCVTVKRYFQVPWHVQDARVIDVLTLVPLSIELLLEPGLEAQMDPPVLMMMRATVIFFDIVVLWMGIRLALVIIALTEAMMRGGMLWDLDDAKERHFGDHPRNYSISVPEDES